MTEHIIKRFHESCEGLVVSGQVLYDYPMIHHHCLEERKGQVNWVAIVTFTKESVSRLFLKRNRLGTMFLVPNRLKVGEILEFGADRLTKTFRHKYREYFEVTEREQSCLTLMKTKVVKTKVRLNQENTSSPQGK